MAYAIIANVTYGRDEFEGNSPPALGGVAESLGGMVGNFEFPFLPLIDAVVNNLYAVSKDAAHSLD